MADAYLTVVLGWADFIGLDLSGWTAVHAWLGRMRQRPAVRKALAAEGLLADGALQ